jgi:nucleoside-diphosphate-sugar epimerase
MDAVKVLVTGAKGFIGKAVCNRLEVLGHKAVAFDLPNDICDRAAVNYACAHVDAAINLAGVLGTAEMIGEEYAAAQANILGAINMPANNSICRSCRLRPGTRDSRIRMRSPRNAPRIWR